MASYHNLGNEDEKIFLPIEKDKMKEVIDKFDES